MDTGRKSMAAPCPGIAEAMRFFAHVRVPVVRLTQSPQFDSMGHGHVLLHICILRGVRCCPSILTRTIQLIWRHHVLRLTSPAVLNRPPLVLLSSHTAHLQVPCGREKPESFLWSYSAGLAVVCDGTRGRDLGAAAYL